MMELVGFLVLLHKQLMQDSRFMIDGSKPKMKNVNKRNKDKNKLNMKNN
jgi:hypothetical protein